MTREQSNLGSHVICFDEDYRDEDGYTDEGSTRSVGDRNARDNEVDAAFLAGTDTTGGDESAVGHSTPTATVLNRTCITRQRAWADF